VNVILAGGSGFLGRALQSRLLADGHTVATLTRRPRPQTPDDIAWTPDGTAGAWARALTTVDIVINLAGEGIADRRWSDERKASLRSSRLLATRSLVAAMQSVPAPPRMFISASAVGYYGARGDEIVTEDDPPGADFLAQLCVDWEREAEQASSFTRVAIVRTGQVLHPDGGALAQMLLPFRMGVGGPVGSGRQYFPWIHRDDWTGLVVWLTHAADARGAFNATAPNPVTSAEFAHALGRVLHRPAFMPVPEFGLRILLGEIAEALVAGQRAIPARAHAMGFQFRYPDLEAALRQLLG
jgi:uncharacterized protein (TIGR01777 family)